MNSFFAFYAAFAFYSICDVFGDAGKTTFKFEKKWQDQLPNLSPSKRRGHIQHHLSIAFVIKASYNPFKGTKLDIA